MSPKRISLSLLACFLLSVSSGSAQIKEELRAVWITNVDSRVLESDKSTAEAMDYLASIGINVVFPVVWNKGYTLYPSRTMEQTFGVSIWPTVAGRDPLDRVIIEAHRNGIEVIPWYEFGFSPHYATGSTDLGFILGAKPAWTLRNSSGAAATKNGEFPQFVWMSGINPEVQDFLISLTAEMLDAYDVDGVQGDDRLPAMPVEGGYDSTTAALYKAEKGGASPPTNYRDAGWVRWRADKLNDFFRRWRDSVKIRSPHLILSSSPSPYPWGYDEYLQDAKTWLDSSIADHIIPQIYRYDYTAYVNQLNSSLNYVPAAKKSSFFSGVLARVGSYYITPEFLVQSIQANRDRGVRGESFFFYEALRYENNRRGDTLKLTHYADRAALPYRNGTVWRPKGIVVNEDDPGADASPGWTRFSGFQDITYRPGFLMGADTGYVSISYTAEIPNSAYYDVYGYIITNTIGTTVAPFTLYSGSDSTSVFMDQSDPKNAGWRRLGTVYLQAGNRRVVKLDNAAIGSGKRVMADAVMLLLNRKLSPDVVISSAEVIRESPGLPPQSFRLGQNYPNPFNPRSIITYEISETSHISIRIYDLLGREQKALVGTVQPAGSHAVDVSAEDLPSGAYFYRMEAIPVAGPNVRLYTQTRRMLVVK